MAYVGSFLISQELAPRVEVDLFALTSAWKLET